MKSDRPILLWKEDPRRGRLVVACCSRARRLGVRVAMPIAQACEMILADGTSPVIGQQDRMLDDESLQQLAGLFQQHITPLVAIEALDEKPWAGHPRHQCESLLGDITGVAHLFGDERGLLKATGQLLETMGVTGRMAIADSVGSAWALSHYAEPLAAESLPTGSLTQRMESLPIESLRISTVTVATLSRLGIERVDQLLQLPRSGLAARLGGDLVRRIEQTLGEVDEPLGVYRAPAEHREVLSLEYPTSDARILADRIERLTKKVRAGLAARQRGALRMACRLDLSAHPPLTLEIGLFAPTIDADHLSGLMINRLETKKLPSFVERLTLSVTLSGPLRSTQASLFDGDFCDKNSSTVFMSGSAISRLVDSLSGRLGRDAVLDVKIEDDPLPEKAFSVSPLAGNSVVSGKPSSSTAVRSRRTAKGSARSSPRVNVSVQHSRCKHFMDDDFLLTNSVSYQPSPEDAMRRPLSLFSEPIPLAVALENGSFCLHVSSPRLPSRLRLDGVIHLVAHHWGPERIETGWWKGPSVRRDYYRIETDRGRWWWIFRNLASKTQIPGIRDTKSRYRWMLHGQFA